MQKKREEKNHESMKINGPLIFDTLNETQFWADQIIANA